MNDRTLGVMIIIGVLFLSLVMVKDIKPDFSTSTPNGSVFLTPSTPEEICKKLPDNFLCKN